VKASSARWSCLLACLLACLAQVALREVLVDFWVWLFCLKWHWDGTGCRLYHSRQSDPHS